MSSPPTAVSSDPLVVVLTENDDEEEAWIDGRPVERRTGESARESALRVVTTGPSRHVDIHTPAGVVLHTWVDGGRLDVLGQSVRPAGNEDEGAGTGGQTEVDTPAGQPAGPGPATHKDPWAERDRPWPVPDDRPNGPEPARGGASRRRGATARRRDRGRSGGRSRGASPSSRFAAAISSARWGGARRALSRTGYARAWEAVRRRSPALDERRIVIALLVSTLLVATGMTALIAADRASAPEVTASIGEPFPGSPPDGWAGQVRWASPDLLTDTPVAVVATGSTTAAVGLVTADRALATMDAASGRTLWSTPLPDGEVYAGPAATELRGVHAVAVHVGRRMMVRAADDGRLLVDAELPEGSEVVLSGDAPLVRVGSQRAGVVNGSTVDLIDLPEGASALSARADGTLLAGGPQGWWHLSSSRPAVAATPWEQVGSPSARPDGAPVVVGALGGFVLTVHPEDPRVVIHQDGDTVRAGFQSPYVPGRAPTWAPSPGRTWGVLGRSLVDLESGTVTDLGDWQTVLVARDHAYGLVDGVVHLARPRTDPIPVTVQTSLAEATTPAGAVVRAEVDGAHRIWVLGPDS